jgi:hypothetical protein
MGEQQIPFGDDRKKSKSKGAGRVPGAKAPIICCSVMSGLKPGPI